MGGLLGRPYHLKVDTLQQQIISNTYAGTQLVELAYCAGRRADALERLHLCCCLLPTLAREVCGLLPPGCDAVPLWAAILRASAHFHYWHDAIHVWKPSFRVCTERKSEEVCAMPHAKLPGLFLCGEAYSTQQGWSEGALAMAALARQALMPQVLPVSPRAHVDLPRMAEIPADAVAYDGRILRVDQLQAVHTGGAMAIKNHLGEDIAELMAALQHPAYVYGLVFALRGSTHRGAATTRNSQRQGGNGTHEQAPSRPCGSGQSSQRWSRSLLWAYDSNHTRFCQMVQFIVRLPSGEIIYRGKAHLSTQVATQLHLLGWHGPLVYGEAPLRGELVPEVAGHPAEITLALTSAADALTWSRVKTYVYLSLGAFFDKHGADSDVAAAGRDLLRVCKPVFQACHGVRTEEWEGTHATASSTVQAGLERTKTSLRRLHATQEAAEEDDARKSVIESLENVLRATAWHFQACREQRSKQ